MTKGNENSITTVRIMAICGFIALSVGTFNNIVFGTDNYLFQPSLLYPYTKYIVPAVNGTCALLALFMFFFTRYMWLIGVIAVINSTLDVLTGFTVLGTFVYTYCFMVLFCLGYAQRHFKEKIYILADGGSSPSSHFLFPTVSVSLYLQWALLSLLLPHIYQSTDFSTKSLTF